MQLEFENGAVVAVEGPAKFRVASADEIELESGNLNAWCPESAHGFRVSTRSATLTDLGTTFGVSASEAGDADFLVLEGEVEVSVGSELRTLPEGMAVRATRSKAFEELAFETTPFRRTWPLTSGILATTGEVIPAPPDTPRKVADYEDDDHVIVIPERRSFLLPDRLAADITSPGRYGDVDELPLHGPGEIAGGNGKRARCFRLRYNPVGQLEYGVFVSFEGSVTFDRPILGIITSARKLDRSDRIASAARLPNTSEPHRMRGLETGPLTLSDSLALSEDRRTITVKFNAGESVDEIRVITEAR
nr:FecR domain-containing protein [Luteolibacter marinus]